MCVVALEVRNELCAGVLRMVWFLVLFFSGVNRYSSTDCLRRECARARVLEFLERMIEPFPSLRVDDTRGQARRGRCNVARDRLNNEKKKERAGVCLHHSAHLSFCNVINLHHSEVDWME